MAMADASNVLTTKDSVAGRAVVIGGSTLLSTIFLFGVCSFLL